MAEPATLRCVRRGRHDFGADEDNNSLLLVNIEQVYPLKQFANKAHAHNSLRMARVNRDLNVLQP
jgi:hypothetical protein